MHKPTVIVVAGPNGTGKTSITQTLLMHEWGKEVTYLNPDQVALERFGNWNDRNAVLQAAHYVEQERNRLLESRMNIAFETVFSTPEKIDFLIRAKQTGYFIRLFFIGTDNPTINAARVADRVMKGGHSVPIDKIISRYSKSILNCLRTTTLVDRLYVYDNSVDFQEAKLLFRAADGDLIKQYHPIPHWARAIFRRVNRTKKAT